MTSSEQGDVSQDIEHARRLRYQAKAARLRAHWAVEVSRVLTEIDRVPRRWIQLRGADDGPDSRAQS